MVKLEGVFLVIMTVLKGNGVGSQVRVLNMVAVVGMRVAVVAVEMVEKFVLGSKTMLGHHVKSVALIGASIMFSFVVAGCTPAAMAGVVLVACEAGGGSAGVCVKAVDVVVCAGVAAGGGVCVIFNSSSLNFGTFFLSF